MISPQHSGLALAEPAAHTLPEYLYSDYKVREGVYELPSGTTIFLPSRSTSSAPEATENMSSGNPKSIHLRYGVVGSG